MKFYTLSRPFLLTCGAMLVILFMTAFFLYQKYSKTYDIQCKSDINYHIEKSAFSLQGIISMDMRHDGRGYIVIEGIMRLGEKQWTLNRDATFSYQKLHNNAFEMSNVRLTRFGRDNAPNEVFSTYFFPLTPGSNRNVTLSKVLNSYIVGSPRAPVFMCIPR